MKVTLAYPYTDSAGILHGPEDVVELDDATGRQLVYDGAARQAADDAEVTPVAEAAAVPEPYNPGEHVVHDVLEYLEKADPTEATRVIAAEVSSARPRVTITGWEAPKS